MQATCKIHVLNIEKEYVDVLEELKNGYFEVFGKKYPVSRVDMEAPADFNIYILDHPKKEL